MAAQKSKFLRGWCGDCKLFLTYQCYHVKLVHKLICPQCNMEREIIGSGDLPLHGDAIVQKVVYIPPDGGREQVRS